MISVKPQILLDYPSDVQGACYWVLTLYHGFGKDSSWAGRRALTTDLHLYSAGIFRQETWELIITLVIYGIINIPELDNVLEGSKVAVWDDNIVP